MRKNKFNIDKYLSDIDKQIKHILSRNENDKLTYDILDTEKTRINKLIILKEKQRQMKVGEIWQKVLGNYDGCIDLNIGHSTGLDIVSHTRKFAIELKNRTNTDNYSSKRSNFDKLAKFKMENPDYTCIYGNINADNEEKTKLGYIKRITHNDIEIYQYVGYKLLELILGENTDYIVEFVKKTIDKYI